MLFLFFNFFPRLNVLLSSFFVVLQERFDRQLKDLRSDLSSKHVTHDRMLAKIEENMQRAVALSMKSIKPSSSSSHKSGLKPPTKPPGPPPPNAKRAPSGPLGPSMSATSALQQVVAELNQEEDGKAGEKEDEKEDEKAELKFQDDVRRTRAMLKQQKKSGGHTTPSASSASSSSSSSTNSNRNNNSSNNSTGAPAAPSVASSLLAPPETKKKKVERQQCPFCLKRFEPDVLVSHKINCDCRTVHCQFCNKGRMVRCCCGCAIDCVWTVCGLCTDIVFFCCHPTLPHSSHPSLTLSTLPHSSPTQARQLKTHEQFCDQNPKNAAKSEKKKCKHCDKFFRYETIMLMG